jgi:hypothetical protein
VKTKQVLPQAEQVEMELCTGLLGLVPRPETLVRWPSALVEEHNCVLQQVAAA